MTKEQAAYCMRSYIDDDRYEHCTNCPYYGANQISDNTFVCESRKAHEMAAETLESISALSADLKAVDRESMDEKVLIGFNMAIALFNKHLGGDTE